MATEYQLRCGDVVRHQPSQETWLVAYADYSTGRLAPFGWPFCEAKIEDCTLHESPVSDTWHAAWVRKILESKGGDPRKPKVRALYGEALE